MSGLVDLTHVEREIAELARTVRTDRPYFGSLSTGRKCAVALILNDIELMRSWGTALDCVFRMSTSWLQACLNVQRTDEFKPTRCSTRQPGESLHSEALAAIVDRGGVDVYPWDSARMAAELLARRAASQLRPGDSLSDDELASIVDHGGGNVPLWHNARIAGELILQRALAKRPA